MPRPWPHVDPTVLASGARRVLAANDRGDLVQAAPDLYPHQWSWDAAFISIGLAHVDVSRALQELRTLLAAQWTTGMIPHIVFSEAPGYYPGPEVWGTDAAAAKPAHVRTSGITQPPVHAIAVARILDLARRRGGSAAREAEEFAAAHLDDLVRWHDWLSRVRDPTGLGLVEIHHGWESGMDNSPRWDAAYAGVRLTLPVELERLDTALVADVSDRPSDEEYRRYLQLVKEMEAVGYDDARVQETVSFRVGDVLLTAVLALAADETARMAASLGRADLVAGQEAVAREARRGVLASVDPGTGRCRDHDVLAGRWVDSETIASYAVALCGGDEDVRRRQTQVLAGPRWAGHPSLARAVPPTVSPDDPGFRPRTYWRGPTWPFLTWLFVWGLERHGEVELAAAWRRETLQLLGDLSFGEYYDPVTGLTAGSHDQSWTAAVALDWLGEA